MLDITIPRPEFQDKPDTVSDLESACIEHMAQNGFYFEGPFDTSGRTIKFAGRPGESEKTEWYKAHEELPDGSISLKVTYNSHHDSIKGDKNFVFSSKTHKLLSDEAREAQRRRVAVRQQQREIEKQAAEEKRKQQAQIDRERFSNASTTGTSPYIERKKIQLHDARLEEMVTTARTETIMLIPMRDEDEEIQALQEIYPSKRLFPDSKKPRDKNFTNAVKGLFHVIGKLENGKPIRVSEGFATAASVYESTGMTIPHVVAFSAGGYRHIIPILKKLYPLSLITICADNNVQDDPTKKNVGLEEARKVAEEFGCEVVYPVFPADKERNSEGHSYADFNDLMIECGPTEVQRQVEQNYKTMHSQHDDEFEETEKAKNDLLIKARASARRRALLQQATHAEIVKDICKQHPSLSDKAEEIASRAIDWAKDYQIGCEVIVDGIPKIITCFEKLDKRFAQLEASGQHCVTIHRGDGLPISDKDFKKRVSSEVVLIGVDSKGQPKYSAASGFWEGHAHKTVYRKIAFTNQPVSADTYNLFRGFGIEPYEGNCDRILRHIKEVICSGNQDTFIAFTKLLAWQIQNIGKPSRVIVLLKSVLHQIGKGTLLQDVLRKIYGHAGFQTSDLDQVLGRFNDTLRGKAYVYLDEAIFSGDRRSADKIKSLATASSLGVETKGIPTIQLPIALNFFLTTNHDDAAYIEESDLRYWLLEVSPHRQKDTSYFTALYSEIEDGGLQAFMHYLLHMNVTDFVPARDVPMNNEAKQAMIYNSINPYDARKWLEECCIYQMILGYKPIDQNAESPWEPWIAGNEYSNGVFHAAYVEWQKTIKAPFAPKTTPDNKFGELLTKVGFEQRIIDRTRRRKLPDSEECLKKVKEAITEAQKK